TPAAVAPIATKTRVKPRTKSTPLRAMRRRAGARQSLPSPPVAAALPARYVTYAGTTGSTHGDTKEMRPAAKATGTLTPSIPAPCPLARLARRHEIFQPLELGQQLPTAGGQGHHEAHQGYSRQHVCRDQICHGTVSLLLPHAGPRLSRPQAAVPCAGGAPRARPAPRPGASPPGRR